MPLAAATYGSDEPATPYKAPPREEARVKQWLSRINAAEKKWDDDFKRMKHDMEFTAGKQWDEQTSIDGDRYVANLTLRNVAQKVSALYARDPKAVAKQRDRLNYQLWDGKIESLAFAFQKMQEAMMVGLPPDPNVMALLNDYQTGKSMVELIDRVGETLEVLYQWQIDAQEPEFKKQMKQLVRRVVTCGVGYVKLVLENEQTPPMTGDGPAERSLSVRLRDIQALVKQMQNDGADGDDPRVQEVQELLVGMAVQPDPNAIETRLVFGFPCSTNLIPDPKCRCLKDFVGADWVAEKFPRPREEVEAYFEVELDTAGPDAVTTFNEKGAALSPGDTVDSETQVENVNCYEVYDKVSRSRFIICEGYCGYLLPPEPCVPKTKRFWPWFTLTFNDVEVEDGLEVSIFPPSDVHLLLHPQKEWNRSRDYLRDHRKSSVPFYISTVPLTAADKILLASAKPGDVIELQGMPPGTDASKVLAAFQPATLNPVVYDTAPLTQDVLMTSGQQEANVGPLSGATATESTIAEQSRLSHASSNVDDLDDLLSDLARTGSELMLRGMSEAAVKRIAGPGAVWPPPDQVEDFVNEVFLEIEAASSGRPNQALDTAKFQQVAPLLLQAGANPKGLVEWGVEVADIRAPMDSLFPLVQQAPMGAQPVTPSKATAAKPPTQPMATNNPMPSAQNPS